jgi:hypothetical protein
MGKRVVLLVALSACGRLRFAAAPDAVDGFALDALPPLPVLAPFGAPTPIGELNAAGVFDSDPTLTRDELEIYFTSDRSGSREIWRAVRLTTSVPFDPPQLVAELTSGVDDSTPELSPDGLEIYFSRGTNIFVATRPAIGAAWSIPSAVTELNTPTDETRPGAMLESGNVMYLYRGAPTFDLYVTARATRGAPWNPPALVSELISGDSEADPWVDDSNRIIYFNIALAGTTDLFVATRPTPDVPFDPAQPLAELNTAQSDADAWLTQDLRTIYFSRGATSSRELYIARR